MKAITLVALLGLSKANKEDPPAAVPHTSYGYEHSGPLIHPDTGLAITTTGHHWYGQEPLALAQQKSREDPPAAPPAPAPPTMYGYEHRGPLIHPDTGLAITTTGHHWYGQEPLALAQQRSREDPPPAPAAPAHPTMYGYEHSGPLIHPDTGLAITTTGHHWYGQEPLALAQQRSREDPPAFPNTTYGYEHHGPLIHPDTGLAITTTGYHWYGQEPLALSQTLNRKNLERLNM